MRSNICAQDQGALQPGTVEFNTGLKINKLGEKIQQNGLHFQIGLPSNSIKDIGPTRAPHYLSKKLRKNKILGKCTQQIEQHHVRSEKISFIRIHNSDAFTTN